MGVSKPLTDPWIQRVSTGRVDHFNYFRCKICRLNKITLSTMGICALRGHMKNQVEGKLSKHNKMMQMINSTKNTLLTLLKSVEPQATGSSTSNPDEASTSAINATLLS